MRLAASRRRPTHAAADEPSALHAAVPLADILRICASHTLAGAAPLPSDLAIAALDAPECAGPGSLTFVGPRTPLRVRTGLRAALILAERGVEMPALADTGADAGTPCILWIDSIHAAMAALLTALRDNIERRVPYPAGSGNEIAPSAVVEGCLQGNVRVGPGAYIGRGSFVGAGSRIEANAVIQEHCLIGRDCVIQAGAVVGCAGFGFFPESAGLAAMPHLAGVEIGDACWIGANTVVAAGVLNPTSLGRGCKLDSHVQIAHNVRIGDGCLLASQSGIAGSTVAGHRLRMGGASSVDGHLRLGNDVSIAACSGVTKDQSDGAVVAGFPALPIRAWRRRQILLKRMIEGGEE